MASEQIILKDVISNKKKLFLMDGETFDVGNIKYNESTTISFFIDCYKGTKYANVRAFVISKGYTGPTSRGIKLTQEELSEILNGCNSLNPDLYTKEENEICKFKRTIYKNTEISVRINRFEGKLGLDIREIYVNNCGELKFGKGIRIKIEYAKKAIELFKEMMEKFKGESEVTDLSLEEKIKQSYIFAGKVCGKIIQSQHFYNIYLSEIDFSVRFINCIKTQNNLKNLTDLLNTDYIDLIMLPNCGEKSIIDARNTILTFLSEHNNYCLNQKVIQTEFSQMNGYQQFPSEFEFLRNYLNESEIREITIGIEAVLETYLTDIDFDTRFQHVLSQLPELKTIRDLLVTSPNQLIELENCGRKSIEKAQEVLLKKLIDKEETKIDINMKHDEYILMKLKTIIKVNRNLDIFLHYYNYDHSEKTSLAEIGNLFSLTRERVRQIVETVKRKISKNKQIFSYMIEEMKDFGYIYEMKSFINNLTDNKKCKLENGKFIENMINDLIDKYDDILIKGRYVITSNPKLLFPKLNLINDLVYNKIKDLQTGIDVTEMILYLKEDADSINEGKSDKLITNQVLTFISEEYKKFYVVNNIIYNEMMYQIYFGNRLKDIVYWSLFNFSVPIHFKQLADFIRKNNKLHDDTPDESIHSMLMDAERFKITERGTYTLTESQVPKYLSASEAIYHLLNEKGPLTENKIIDCLKDKYSYYNIKFGLKNNINKRLLRIGNDLYDIKN